MEIGVFLPCLDQFMLSPLVTWVKTFMPHDGGMHLDFSELLDGVFLNDIMTQINPSATPQGANKVSRDPSRRIQNLNFLVQQIKTYYLDNLRQVIMIPLPNVLLLSRTPYCEQSLEEMKKLLLLLLGCAVQCEKKEEYIERIRSLDFDTKAAIAAHIQELTHSQENVLDLQWLESSEVHPDELEAVARNMATHLRQLLDQRDTHLETIAELMQEKEGVVSLLNTPSSPQSGSYSPNMQQQTGTQQHLAVELADSKAKIRRFRQELEEKSEQMLDCRHELENMEAELKRIQQENSQLLVDARASRTYRDELDALRERAIKADKLESEVGRYREQLHKMEFYKSKVEELKEDNRVLQETKEVLGDQLAGWRARSDKIHQLEKHSLLLKARVHDMEQERNADRRRIDELQEENLALCLAQRRSMEESQHLGWELEQLSKTTENSQGQQTLSEEVSERTRSRMLKLEKENQSLLRSIEELRAASINNSAQPKHGHHLQCEHVCQVVCTTDEPTGLQTTCSHIENRTNVFPLSTVTQQMLNGGSHCHQPLHAEDELEGVQSEILLTENPDLHMKEKGQLEDGDHFKELMSDLDVLENNHNRLHCFVGSRDSSPGSKSSSPCHDSIFTGLPTRSSYASKHTQRLEAKCRALDTVNQHLQTSLDNTDRKVQRLEAEVQELEAENQSLQATLEELRISARRLEQLETEKQSLEQETTVLEREKRQLEKENRRLRQQAEIQEANLDSSNVCIASLEREMRFLVKEVEGLRETAERVKGLERDNRELSKQAAIDQRTLATLREELVSEKLKTQQRNNELERLAHDLEMKALSQESAEQAEPEAPDTSRFKMLESELESSLKKSLRIKEDKMAALEARLQESSTLNQQLRQELKTVKLSYEALQQRHEEEWTASSSTPPRETGKVMSEWLRESQEATKELLKLKDRLIEVERNNATLEAERQAMQAQLRQLESQSDSQQAQVLALQRQAASLQENNTALQTHNANLQVEKSTLNSQSASLMAQNAQLQQQQSGTESERDGAMREREDLRVVHEQLLRDHERLAALHERQAMEYEALMGKHGCVKNAHRTLELEHRTLQDRYNSLLQQRTKLEDLEKALKEEQLRMALEKEQHRTTAAECRRLHDEKDWLNQTYRQLLNDNELLTADHKQLKSQLNEAKLEHTWLEADFSKLKKEFQQLDITSTKLTNQCELLGQLKGNLEEENRHLLSQIETLMLQNRTLLEQTMESKDLFHVEERQYIDKLNDLRRQKEKLEEKIMDQYKFYEPSPPRRRGNWITLKLKKLIKSNSREHGPDCPPTPTSSGFTEPHLTCQDNSSFVSSDGSGGSALAGDAISPQRNSTTKMFPRMRNRLKDRDKVKSLFRRSMSLSSLAYPSAQFEADRWADSSERLEGSEAGGGSYVEDRKNALSSSHTTSILSILHLNLPTTLPSGHVTITTTDTTTDTVPDVSELWVTDKDSNDSAVPSGFEDDELQNHGLNGVQSRAQSESSGEFSLSLENEPWSNGSSPVKQPPSRHSFSSFQPPSDTSTPQHTQKQQQRHKEKASTMPITNSQNSDIQSTPQQKKHGLSQDFWLTRGTKSIRRGPRGKVTRRSSDSTGTVKMNPGPNGMNTKSTSSKAETTQTIACSPIAVLYVQGKSSSVSGCLNCFSTPLGKEGRLKGPRSPKSLPRASSVISTAEGSSRRCSVNSDCRATVKTDPLSAKVSEGSGGQEETVSQPEPETNNSEPEPIPPVKPPRDPAVFDPTDGPKSPVQESLFGSSFTFNSVFSNTIFSDSVVTTSLDALDTNQTFLCLNPSLVQNCPLESQESTPPKTPQTLLNMENEQSQNAEHAAGIDEKDKPLTIA
ncbi:girdin-like isoform X1 [Sander lucioperca]|uniref:girdin-like isoform X1 n=1 Tax=Sander lucioperca TaxID=283035 RepID=UPI00125D41EB|nr:girdin-like isoform X1 [Sander lucioperca]XP_035856728.1 girdin-like isoform X1 [Sander lucioperca]